MVYLGGADFEEYFTLNALNSTYILQVSIKNSCNGIRLERLKILFTKVCCRGVYIYILADTEKIYVHIPNILFLVFEGIFAEKEECWLFFYLTVSWNWNNAKSLHVHDEQTSRTIFCQLSILSQILTGKLESTIFCKFKLALRGSKS